MPDSNKVAGSDSMNKLLLTSEKIQQNLFSSSWRKKETIFKKTEVSSTIAQLEYGVPLAING